MTQPEGILLINLGSPAAPRTREVRRYLREFLSDPRVIDIPAVARWLLLNLIILPIRPRKSAAAYRSIWSARGSPLLAHTQDLAQAVATALDQRAPGRYVVKTAMRYGQPDIRTALAELHTLGVQKIHVLPLYPQYSTSASSSVIAKVYEEATRFWNVPVLRVVPPFYNHPAYLDALAAVSAEHLTEAEKRGKLRFDRVLFSFHGIPERHLLKGNVDGYCRINEECCAGIGPKNLYCYRAHCYATARELARRLKLADGAWSVSFQSRLGRTPWLRPFTDIEFEELPRLGVKHLAVLSPAFVADCLETLEELDMRGRETFRAAGGESFTYVPCLNSDEHWVRAVVTLLLSD